MDKKKLKLTISNKLKEIDLSELFDDEVKEANKMLEYLDKCLWMRK